jgi:hypothetical protein
LIVPLLSLYILAIKNPILLKVEDWFHHIIGTVNDYIQALFANIVRAITASKILGLLSMLVLIALFISSEE